MDYDENSILDEDAQRQKLLKALFKVDKEPTQLQFDRALEVIQADKPRFANAQDNTAAILDISRQLKFRLSQLQPQLIERRQLLKDKVVSDLIRDLNIQLSPEFERNLSVEDCPDLPPVEGLESRITPGRDDDADPLFLTFSDVETLGSDDTPLLNNATARVVGPLCHANAQSSSTGRPVRARATLSFFLFPGLTSPQHEILVRLHLAKSAKGLATHVNTPSTTDYRFMTRIGMKVFSWSENQNLWQEAGEEELTLFDLQPSLRNFDHDMYTVEPTFGYLAPELIVDPGMQVRPRPLLVSLTVIAEASAPTAHVEIIDPNDPPDQSAQTAQASSRADIQVVLCAADIGFVPKTITVERSRHTRPTLSIQDVL